MLRDLIIKKELQLKEKNHIIFDSGELNSLSLAEVRAIEEHFHGFGLMALPKSEVAFFEWLKKEDREIWNDLWGDENDAYLVSVDFLHHFTAGGNGFPICDLVEQDNYWFHKKHIKPKGMERITVISEKLQAGSRLSLEETLLAEILHQSIDLWHFCYKHEVSINLAKRTLLDMISEELIVHLADREDLVKYLDV